MNFNEIKYMDSEYCIQNYDRYDVAFQSGRGSCLYDTEGKEYLDFGSGIGVNSIGYANPHWVRAVSLQAEKLQHVSNLYYQQPGTELASRLTVLSGMNAVFFGNSGAEANEAAIKLVRKYSYDKYGTGRAVIVTLLQSFHGRTMATLTATGQADYHRFFHPFVEGFRYVPANDIQAMEESLKSDVCGIMIEGIQGEGGVIPLKREYVKAVENLARERDILLIFDEVQTGNGRTGTMYSYQGFGAEPDVVTTAKGLGGGLPIGAMLISEKCKGVLSKGSHGSTFGANPICCAAANAVLDIITEEGFLESVKRRGEMTKQILCSWAHPHIKEVRGKGLMLGVQLEDKNPKDLVKRLLENGMVALTAGKDVLRLLPPLTISEEEIKKGLNILRSCLDKV